jgi:hypothetical protein
VCDANGRLLIFLYHSWMVSHFSVFFELRRRSFTYSQRDGGNSVLTKSHQG